MYMVATTMDLVLTTKEVREMDEEERLEYAYLKGKHDIGRWADYVLD